MSGKRLLPLAALLIVLVIVAIVVKRPQTPPNLVVEAALERLVPATVRPDAITGMAVYQGAQPEVVVTLRRKEGAWFVPSYFDAPGNATKIQDVLKQVSAVQGELRAESAALHQDFSIADNQALHLRLYTDSTEKPAVHLLVGKGKGSNGFMRRAGEDRVYAVDVNLHSVAGLYGENVAQAPTAKPWLELHMQNIPKEQVTAVELHTPERRLRFTLPSPPTPPASATPGAETPPPPPASWTLVAPAWSYAVKQEAVESLVSGLRTVQAEDIVDPAKLSEYGLENASYRAILMVQASGQDAREVSVLVGHEISGQEGKRYARLGQSGPVYVLAQWTWQRLFPALGTLLTAPLFPGLSQEEITQVSVQHAEHGWRLERPLQGTAVAGSSPEPLPAWIVSDDPQTAIDAEAVSRFLDTVTQLTADDILDIPTSGLDIPALELQFTWRDGQTAHVTFGKFSGKDDKSYYIKRRNATNMFVVSASAYEKLESALTAVHTP